MTTPGVDAEESLVATEATSSTEPTVMARLEVTGVVQGVGFRPFVHRLAAELDLRGHVGNDASGVFAEVAGASRAVDDFARRLADDAPPLARVDCVRRMPLDAVREREFVIVDSRDGEGPRTLVPPDSAVCDDCLTEMTSPADRRFRHPFITCTNCGPRFTIIRELPYDRPRTTMADFAMCGACAAEYRDPGDRRYHAQPIACHECGPTLVFLDPPSDTASRDARTGDLALAAAVDALARGRTVAVKGLGGYHLACDARRADAIATLRSRKHRPDKPFAVMVADVAGARMVAHVDDAEERQLRSPARPVVLMRARDGTPLSTLVAPGNPLVGVMLPYTPVHHLLFDGLSRVGVAELVMTSGNTSGEPIVHRDDEVATRLGPMCDAVLAHDRPIHVPCDDSVVRLVDGELLPVRRARGYAPIPVASPGARRSVLAVGGELKNTFTVGDGRHFWVSQHIGDMENLETLRAFESSVAGFRQMYGVDPAVVAVDAHPGYLTARWARRGVLAPRHPGAGDRGASTGQVVEVQHHHAHVAAVMAEQGLDPSEPVIGFAFDGTGYGADGAIWGGEVLVATAAGYERVAHLAPVPLPGGDAAIRNPYRVALAHLRAAGVSWDGDLAPAQQLDDHERSLLAAQLDRGISCVPTTSMGRLFDAVASLLDLRHRITYEAQAAIDLEIAASAAPVAAAPYAFDVRGHVADAAPLWRSMIADLRDGAAAADVAWGFHEAVVALVVALATRTSVDRDLATVVLSGGVFQNALLTRRCREELTAAGLDVLSHRVVPPNDGGLSLGQAFVAAHRHDLADRSSLELSGPAFDPPSDGRVGQTGRTSTTGVGED